jgi:hypothetical protein
MTEIMRSTETDLIDRVKSGFQFSALCSGGGLDEHASDDG